MPGTPNPLVLVKPVKGSYPGIILNFRVGSSCQNMIKSKFGIMKNA
jgi:hypothetical protein